MSALNIFMTGGTGYIGLNVVAELCKRGLAVTALTRKPLQLPGCRTVVGDLANIGTIAHEIATAGAIIHLASSRSCQADLMTSDIVATENLIQAWRNGPFLFASSAAVGGWGPEPLSEQAPARVSSNYVLGKVCNEFQLRVAQSLNHREPAISLRPAGLFISTNHRRHSRQRFSILYQQSLQNCKFVFLSEEGLETYGTSFIGGADFARAAADALDMTVSGSYNIAGGFCTWKLLIETVNRITGTSSDFIIRQNGRVESGEFLLPQSRTCLDDTAFKAQVGFVPQQSLEQLVEEFVAAERANVA
jgi:nucleoside-diphosphate-sugar epimerase